MAIISSLLVTIQRRCLSEANELYGFFVLRDLVMPVSTTLDVVSGLLECG